MVHNTLPLCPSCPPAPLPPCPAPERGLQENNVNAECVVLQVCVWCWLCGNCLKQTCECWSESFHFPCTVAWWADFDPLLFSFLLPDFVWKAQGSWSTFVQLPSTRFCLKGSGFLIHFCSASFYQILFERLRVLEYFTECLLVSADRLRRPQHQRQEGGGVRWQHLRLWQPQRPRLWVAERSRQGVCWCNTHKDPSPSFLPFSFCLLFQSSPAQSPACLPEVISQC